MYAVIFTAKVKDLDEAYAATAARMRERAMSRYGCTEFISAMEGGQEIAVSYWETQEQIRQWKEDAEHLAAQELGRSTWYESYRVQVVQIIRESRSRA